MAQAIESELPGVEVMTVADQASTIRNTLAILFAVMGGLFSIAIFVGGVSVANTMTITVHQRTREIGLKKALGAENGDVLAEVLVDAGKLGAIGGMAGVSAAWLVTVLINLFARDTAAFSIMELTPRLVVASMAFSTLLGTGSGLLPAWRAARLDPVVALRTE
jgi:putative ABC transport system permease protein